ncbi:MAG: hypothetical protein B7Z08_07025 [Sphingomonadales bacterium 32-68-7]|nr:MAG: hypothetical protein B7Z33_03950 [Sphingomonadales bacterium 12-68-11]OYX08994.1 MAG: hypothetical protein B7Z08_07025 [Sphingomonadales bacterium 32-68-7]
MTRKPHLARSAGSALVAALALTATQVAAQDVAVAPPPIDIAPTITVPDIAPATPPAIPQVEAPVTPPPVAAVPAPAPVAAQAAPPARTRAAPAAQQPAAPAPAFEPETPEIALTPETLPPAALPAPVAADIAENSSDEPVARNSDAGTIAAIGGGLAGLALLGWGLIAFNRRRTPPRAAAATSIEPETLQSRGAAAIVPTAPIAVASVSVQPDEPVSIGRPVVASPSPASLSHGGASVALPRELPASFEERDALIKRMVAAKPDRANPFTSPMQRHRRAKLILQSLGRDFGDAKPWIDLSQYPQNWPGLAQRYPAAA